ncbi:hypothetical protein BGX34_001661 [Mortierella sp. NVP85]|nr:hypothetical protein BGX34_001661 [Mortierella sp. NVP85]
MDFLDIVKCCRSKDGDRPLEQQTTNHSIISEPHRGFGASGTALRQVGEKPFAAGIFATDVSASGEYIAVLSADYNNAYIHILNINDALHVSEKSDITIPLQQDQFIAIQHVGVTISSDGTYVALYLEPHGNFGTRPGKPSPFPFCAFEFRSASEKDPQKGSVFGSLGRSFDKISQKLARGADYTNDSPEKWNNEWSPIKDQTISQLKDHFIGYGKFLARDKFKSDNEVIIEDGNSAHGNYFVAVNESRINVYDVDNDKQNVSVWDLKTGSNIKYISVNNPDNPNTHQDIISYLAVSPGGKLLALAGKDWIRTYFMDSCIEICETTIDDGSVLSIEFIDQGKNLLVTTDKPSPERTLVIMDALNLSARDIHTTELPPSFYSSPHIARPSTAPGRYGVMMTDNQVPRVYDVLQPGKLERAPLVRCQGEYVTNPSREPSRSANNQASSFDTDTKTYKEHTCHDVYSLVVDFEHRRKGDQQQKLWYVRLCRKGLPIMTVIPEPWRTLDVNDVSSPVKASFLPPWPQFIIVTPSGFQVWNLPCTNSDNQCGLALSWVMPRSGHAKFRDGKIDGYVQMIEKAVVIDGTNVRITISGKFGITEESVSIPKTQWFAPSETIHCINSFPLLASCYFDSSLDAQDAIIRYVFKHINHVPSGHAIGKSVMDAIAWSAKWKCCSDILGIILGSIDGKWIPRCTPTMRIKDGHHPDNPISLLLKNAKKDAYALSMAEQMMDYCIREAKSRCDPAFLHPVSACLPELVDYHPDIAIYVTLQSSLVPVRNKNFVVDRAIISPPLLTRVLDWVMRTVMKKRKRAIYRYEDPVFQLKSQLLSIAAGDFTTNIMVAAEIIPNPVNHERFREEIYVVPYSLLWHYRDEVTTPKSANAIMTWINTVMTWAKDLVTWIIKMVSTKQNIIYKAITLGCYAAVIGLNTLNPLHKPTLRLNFRSRKYHKSPAIAALIGYKWNSVAWKAWTIRMLYQGLFLVSVILITGNQIYPVIKIWNLIIPICLTMVLGILGLYLEALEFTDDYKLYLSSPYNPVDVVGYLIPTAGFLQLLISIIMFDNTNAIGDTRVLSIGISVVYLLAGGDFSSISEYIKSSGDLTFLFVIAAYYAFMVFLLLNVLIAVMNSTTARIEGEGTLTWLDNLYHHVGKAENLSFAAPGLRQRYDKFPQYVYYTVSQKRIKEFEESGNSLGPQEKGAE